MTRHALTDGTGALILVQGAKYDKAVAKVCQGEWSTHVVSPAWLWDSASSRKRLDEESYGIVPHPRRPPATAAHPSPTTDPSNPRRHPVGPRRPMMMGHSATTSPPPPDPATRAELAALRARVTDLERSLMASAAETARARSDLAKAAAQTDELFARARRAEQRVNDTLAAAETAKAAVAAEATEAVEAARAREMAAVDATAAAEAHLTEALATVKAAEAAAAWSSRERDATAVRAVAAEVELEGCRVALAAATARITAESERAAVAEAAAEEVGRRCEALERAASEALAAAAPSPAAPRGPLDGARAYIDPSLPEGIAAAARAALAAAGGSESAGWHAGGGCTHVVVAAAGAAPYLARMRAAAASRSGEADVEVQDLFVVTPQWLTRTAGRGRRARCCVLSPDAAAAVASSCVGGAGGAHLTGPDSPGVNLGTHAMEEDTEVGVVEKMERIDVKEAAAAAAAVAGAEVERRRKAGRSHRSGTWPKSVAPRVLLEGVCWAVTESPDTARWYADGTGGFTKTPGLSGSSPPPESNGASLGYGGVSQLTADAEGTTLLTDAMRDQVVYTLPFITLLLPADRFQEVGLRAFTTKVPDCGLKLGDLLRLVHQFYAAPLEPEEERELMLCDSKYAARLRAAHAKGERTARGTLLGSLRTVECLRRCAGGGSAAYELVLIA